MNNEYCLFVCSIFILRLSTVFRHLAIGQC